MGMYSMYEDNAAREAKLRETCDMIYPIFLKLLEDAGRKEDFVHAKRKHYRSVAERSLRAGDLTMAMYHLRLSAIPMDDIEHIITLLS